MDHALLEAGSRCGAVNGSELGKVRARADHVQELHASPGLEGSACQPFQRPRKPLMVPTTAAAWRSAAETNVSRATFRLPDFARYVAAVPARTIATATDKL